MTARRVASRVLLALGLLLLAVALLVLLAVRLGLVKTEGLEDLGRVVAAMLLGGVGGAACALGLLLAPRRGLPRWQVLLGGLACLPAALAGYAFLSTGAPGPRVFGALLVLLALAGLVAAGRLLWAPRRGAPFKPHGG